MDHLKKNKNVGFITCSIKCVIIIVQGCGERDGNIIARFQALHEAYNFI